MPSITLIPGGLAVTSDDRSRSAEILFNPDKNKGLPDRERRWLVATLIEGGRTVGEVTDLSDPMEVHGLIARAAGGHLGVGRVGGSDLAVDFHNWGMTLSDRDAFQDAAIIDFCLPGLPRGTVHVAIYQAYIQPGNVHVAHARTWAEAEALLAAHGMRVRFGEPPAQDHDTAAPGIRR